MSQTWTLMLDVCMFVVPDSLIGFDHLFSPEVHSCVCVQISGLLKLADQHQTNDRKLLLYITAGLSFSASTHTSLFVCPIQIDVVAHAVYVWYKSGCQIDLLVNRWGNINTAFDDLRLLYLSFTQSTERSLTDRCNELYYFAVCRCQVWSWQARVEV